MTREQAAAGTVEALRRRARQQTLVAELGRSALTGTPLDELATEALAAVADGLAAERVGLLEQTEPGLLHCRTSLGWQQHELRPVRVDADSQVAETYRKRETSVVADFSQGSRFPASAHLLELGLRSGVAVPVRGEEDPVAVLVAHAREPDALGDDAVVFVRAVANVLAVAIARESAEERRRETEADLAFLAEAGHVLASSLDYDSTLRTLGALVVPRLADWFIVDLAEPNGSFRRVAVAASDPEKQELIEQLSREYSARVDGPSPASRAIGRQETVFFPDFTPESLRKTTVDERHFELMRGLDPRSAVAVPLRGREGMLGALTFSWSESGRRFDEAWVRLAEEVARRASIAIENSRLYDGERRARAAAEEARGRLTVLVQASGLLASSPDERETLPALARLLVPLLADAVAIYLLGDEDGTVSRLIVEPAERFAGAATPPVPELPPSLVHVVRTGRSELPRRASRSGPLADAIGADRISLMRVPLVSHGRTHGVLVLAADASSRRYRKDDLRSVESIAARAALAIDNARLYHELEQRAEAARALATVADGVCLLDRDGLVRVWNRAAAAITGLSAEQLDGQDPADFLEGWEEAVEIAPLAGPDEPSRLTPLSVPVSVGGHELWLSLVGVAAPEATVYTFRDVSDERRLDRLKSEFVATVSHELRTPLTAVYGAAKTLAGLDLAERPELRAALMRQMVDQSERLAAIIDDILLSAELEAGRLRLRLEPLDPVASARDAVEATRSRLGSDAVVELTSHGLLEPLDLDASRLRQILDNLIENAVKYSPPGSAVAVHVEGDAQSVRFTVADDGVGIPAAERSRIFEKFYRLDPEQRRGVGGNGLGLYVCRELVQRMGGRIRVDSRPGRGSRFTVDLPRTASG